jgi:hypothetical protein
VSATLEDQRLLQLKHANEIRSRRAQLKAEIARGETTLAEVLNADHDWIQTMRVVDLLRPAPGLGPVRVKRALIANRITPSLRLESFCPRRRQELLIWLTTNCPSAVIG